MATNPTPVDDGGIPRSLVAFTLATLVAVAGVALMAVTGSAAALIVALFLMLVVLAAVLREVESEIDPRPAPDPGVGAADGAIVGAVPPAWSAPRAHRRVLLVVSEPVDRAELATILQDEPRGSTAVLVVAPALQRTWLRYWVSDTDEGSEHARSVEEATLDALRREGVLNAGHVGSAEPLTAIEDALRFFDADRIVIAMHPGDERRYRERDLRAEVESRFGVPTSAIAVSARS